MYDSTDLSAVKDPLHRAFLDQFFTDRQINLEFYRLVPETSYDYRMVKKKAFLADSVREGAARQIDISWKYILAIQTGALKLDGLSHQKYAKPVQLTKEELLAELSETRNKVFEQIVNGNISGKLIKVPGSDEPIGVIDTLWGLDAHETFYHGWNLSLMHHLGIEKFPQLKAMWGI